MKRAFKVTVLSALVLGSMALNGSIKQKLSEQGRKNLAEVAVESQVDADVDQSMCGLPMITPPSLTFCNQQNTTPAGAPPVSGSGTSTSFNSVTSAQQGEVVVGAPNTGSASNCSGTCEACSALNEQSVHQAQKERHFCISGDICIIERVCESECGAAQEMSDGKNAKSNSCTTINSSGTGSGSTNPGPVCVQLTTGM